MGYPIQTLQTTRPLMFLMVLASDHISPATGLTPTVTLSKNGAAFISPSGAVTEVGNGWYKVAGNSTDANQVGPMILHATGTGADPTDDRFDVVGYNPNDTVRMGLTSLPSAAAGAASGLITAGATGNQLPTNAIVAASIATDAIGSDELAATAVTEIQSGLATAASITTLQADTDDIQARLPASLVGGRIDSSVGAMQNSTVTAAAVATDAINANAIAATAVTEIQAGLATSAEVASVQADTDNIQSRLPAALVGGKMDSSVGSLAAGSITAATFAAGAIDASAIATDAIGSDELAASAVTEVQGGIAGSVWTYPTRTLTGTVPALTFPFLIDAGTISVPRGDTWTVAFTNLGDLTGRTKLWFSLKRNMEHLDSQALVQVEETAGLVVLNGAAGTPSLGTLVVSNAVLGDLTVTVHAGATAQIVPANGLAWDVQMLKSGAIQTLSGGLSNVRGDVTRAVS